MKKWTVVVEITIDDENEAEFDQGGVDRFVSETFSDRGFPFRIMEVIAAPYGPQHPGGVFITEMKCICRKGSAFHNPKCTATVHHP